MDRIPISILETTKTAVSIKQIFDFDIPLLRFTFRLTRDVSLGYSKSVEASIECLIVPDPRNPKRARNFNKTGGLKRSWKEYKGNFVA